MHPRWNGRFHPPDENPNDPDKDFPIREALQDFAGKERKFEITFHEVGLGYSVQAVELDKEDGYYFRAFDPNSPYLALGNLRAKMQRMLSIRHLQRTEHGYRPTHDTLRGHITTDVDTRETVFVVDGIPLSLEQFEKIVQGYEGFQFSLRFVDPTEEVP